MAVIIEARQLGNGIGNVLYATLEVSENGEPMERRKDNLKLLFQR